MDRLSPKRTSHQKGEAIPDSAPCHVRSRVSTVLTEKRSGLQKGRRQTHPNLSFWARRVDKRLLGVGLVSRVDIERE